MTHRQTRAGLIALALASAAIAGAQADSQHIWTAAPLKREAMASHLQWLGQYESFHVDSAQLRRVLNSAPLEVNYGFSNFTVIELPTPNGTFKRFKLVDSPIIPASMSKKYDIHTYRVRGVDDPSMSGRLDIGPNGFNGFILGGSGSYVITPPRIGAQTESVIYYRSENYIPRNGICMTQNGFSSADSGTLGITGLLGPGDNLKTYRLAMNATGEYTTFYGSQANAVNGVITSVNRCNAVYEIDLAIHMNIVYNMCYTNSATDPFTNNSGGTMLGQNQTACDTNVGNANYDIGHVFSTGGGGVAGLKVVGVTGQKARGVTGLPAPIGDAFDIDFVAHEMGHQYGANHTFNGTTGNCGGGNRASGAAYEPGSGSTIMAYAGICGAEDLQPHSDPYFHYKSIEEIYAWRNNAGSGGTQTSVANSTPVTNAGADYTIPQSTPFKLTATGSDPDNDPIKFCWEQYNLGTATPSTDYTTRPLFRSFNPTTNPVRFCPRLPDVLSGAATPWEIMPPVNRSMTFRSTIRDNHPGAGGYATDTMVITVSGSAFSVTSPNTAVSWPGGSTQTVTWNVGGGSVAPNVNILLSTDGGNSYGNGTATVLLANTPNDGSETITVPNTATSQARIIVEGAGNIFYDVSNVNFTITNTNNPVPAISSLSPSSATAAGPGFNLTVNGSNFVATSVVRWNGNNRTTTFNSASQLTAAIPASDIAFVGNATVTVFNPAPGGGTSNSLTFTINPIQLGPNSLTLLLGQPVSGGLPELQSSDNAYLVGAFRYDGLRTQPNLQWEVGTNSTSTTMSRLDLAVEVKASSAGQQQVIQVKNNTTGNWDTVDTSSTSLTDTTRNVSITTGASNYIGAGGLILVRLNFKELSPPFSIPIVSVDYVHFTIYP